jgi:hypothetical protein
MLSAGNTKTRDNHGISTTSAQLPSPLIGAHSRYQQQHRSVSAESSAAIEMALFFLGIHGLRGRRFLFPFRFRL